MKKTGSGPEPDADAEGDEDQGHRANAGLAAGYTLVGALVVGLLIGYAIDVSRDSSPTWTVTCAVIFLFVGLYQVVKDALK